MVRGKERSLIDLSKTSPYEIRIVGVLDDRWSEWFNSIRIKIERSDDLSPQTILYCPTMDQAKLRGILNKIWDLNLNLLSVHRVQEPSQRESQNANNTIARNDIPDQHGDD
jgi:hypothetical protein